MASKKPCDTCTIVKFPGGCERKQCREWQVWWLEKWEETRKIVQKYIKGGEADV